MIKGYLIIFGMAVLIISESFADSDQITRDFDLVLQNYSKNRTSAIVDSCQSDDGISELKFFATGMIKLYQTAISSQDVPACNFTPSCSRFALDAINQGGFMKGALLGADRLLRCHWFSAKLYHDFYGFTTDNDTYKLYDPAERYLHFEKSK